MRELPYRLHKRLIRPINTSLEERLRLDPVPTGQITEGLWVIRTDTVNFFIADTGDGLACFDAGYRRMLIRDELARLGLDRLDVAHVFLTHADIDHTRGLSLFPNADVYLSHEERQMITGLRSVRRAVRSPRLRCPYRLLRDGDVVKAGQARVEAVETPGHTPGSMAYILGGTHLFTGDTCKLADGRIYAGSHYTMDIDRQYESIRKLSRLENIRYVFTAHAGFTDNFDAAFWEWRTEGNV